MIANGDVVDLCPEDPGHDVDIYITASLEHLIALWMGDVGIQDAIDAKTVFLDAPRHLMNTAQDWISQSPLVGIQRAGLH